MVEDSTRRRWGLTITARALVVGAAAGLLSTVLAGFVFALVLGAVGAGDPFSGGLTAGAVAGLLTAGLVAGRLARVHPPLHGSLAALITVVIVATDALLRGSTAGPGILFLYAALATGLGAAGGRLGGGRRP